MAVTWMLAVAALIAPTAAHTALAIGVSPVLTSSMVPWVEPGDVLITKGTAATSVREGDVIAAESLNSKAQFAHRIIDVTPANGLLRVTTKGDANPTADVDPVMLSAGAQVPLAIGHVKWIGFPLAFMSSPEGQRLALTLLIGANVLALIVFAAGRRPRTESPTNAALPHESEWLQQVHVTE